MNKIIKDDINNILAEDLPWTDLENKTFLISGANGFIPSYLVRTLLAIDNVKVIALVRNENKARNKFAEELHNKNFKLLVQDISTPFYIEETIDYIIHAASQASPKYYGNDPVGTLKANTLGTSYLLDIARKSNIIKFIYFSSGEVYGVLNDKTIGITEAYTGNVDFTSVRSCYAESKRMGENMCVCYSHQYNIPVNMIRLSHTYGPGVELDDGRVFGDFVADVLNNRDIILNSDGSAKRSFCYISDMIRAFFYILFFGQNKNAYNIASDKETSILELATTLVNLYSEKNLKVQIKENTFVNGYIKSTSNRASFNVEKLKNLGWKEKINLKEGFKRMIESYGDALLYD